MELKVAGAGHSGTVTLPSLAVTVGELKRLVLAGLPSGSTPDGARWVRIGVVEAFAARLPCFNTLSMCMLVVRAACG